MVPQPRTEGEKNQLLFMKWLAKTAPHVYNAYITSAEARQELSGLFDVIKGVVSGVGSFANDLLQQAPALLQQYGTTKTQLEQIKLNFQRVQQGQPPVNPDGSPVTSQQVPGALPATPDGQLLTINTGFFARVPTWVWIAGGVAGAWFLWQVFKPRRG